LEVAVEGGVLLEHADTLRQLNSNMLVPVHNIRSAPFGSQAGSSFYMNNVIYYIFETTDGQKLFDVAFWGHGQNGYNTLQIFMQDF